MAAYAAVICLKHTIQHLLTCNSHIPVVSSSRDIIGEAYEELTSLRKALRRLDGRDRRSSRRVLEALDGEIRDAVYKLEDVIESHIVTHYSQKELLISFEQVRLEIAPLIEEVKKTKELYINELDNLSPPDQEEVSSSCVDFDIKKSNIVGLDDSEIKDIKLELMGWRMAYEMGVVSIVGIGGTGRTILAKAAFEHRDNTYHDTRAWVSVGPKYQLKEIMMALLSQIDDQGELSESGDEGKLGEQVYTKLKGRRYLIALDNVCDTMVWDYLRRVFPAQNNGSRVLLTTSLLEVARFANCFETYQMPVMNEEKSWDLIRELVFDKESCTPELEEAGKKIAENCQGLGVEIIKAVCLLSRAEKTLPYWNKIAAEKQNCVSTDAYDETSQISQITEHLLWDNLFCHVDDDDDGDVSSATYYAKVIEQVLDPRWLHFSLVLGDLFQEQLWLGPKIVSLVGMAGIGKTTFAREIFDDPSTLHRFDHRVWITLGPKYQYERMLVDILAQIDPSIDKVPRKGDEIFAILSYKRCLIVLDDVWDEEPLHYLNKLFIDIKFEVLLTTRLKEIAYFEGIRCAKQMRLLNKEESWCLFCEKVFGEKSCPIELEKPGRMIAENCEGLPLMIVTIASLLLSQPEKTPQFWNKVARKQNLVFEDAYDKISNILLPSYEYLPQHLKPFFLYMGVFPQMFEVPTSKLLKLWNSEGILELDVYQNLEKLDYSSLLIIIHKSHDYRIKICRLHSVFWHLCMRTARNVKFFYVLNSNADDLEEGINGQRRLCIHNNILFGIKDVHTLMASNSTVRSLLCTGPHNQYPVPMCFSFTLLRIMDALTIRFYEFPVGAFELVQLKLLALSYNGKLPACISTLRNLQYLIVKGHMSIKVQYGAPLYMPKEIWDMKQLKHLQVMGGDLPDPCGAVLPDLLMLLDVSPRSCTESVFRGTPNLQKLGIRIELAPNAFESLLCFDNISLLQKLESLKCVVMNPELRSEVVPPPAHVSMFPSSLRKLSLSGLGYPWKYMSVIGKLQNLEVLKLRCYAFRGPEWVMHDGEFMRLKYLLIEDTDLVYWRADEGYELISFYQLDIRHCYKLQEIPSQAMRIPFDWKVELVDCQPSASKKILLKHSRVNIHSSWE